MRFGSLSLDAVNRATFTDECAAGKAVNVAKALKLLGEEPLAMGFVGGDRGEQVRALMARRGVQTQFLSVATRTRQCTTVIDDATGTVTELVEESLPVAAAGFEQLLADFFAALPRCRAAILSGTVAPGGPADFYLRCAQHAQKAGVLCVIDAQGQALQAALAARPGVIKPNKSELSATLGRRLEAEADLVAACREMLARGAQQVVVTAGKGAVVAVGEPNCWRIEPPQIQALNPIGSGDAFTAGLVWRLLRGDNLGQACRWAAAAGAANALTLMPGEFDPTKLQELVGQTTIKELH